MSAGVRYAAFKSTSSVLVDGISESYLSADFGLKYGDEHFNRFTNVLETSREFEGVGPTLSWDSAVRLLGNEEVGHADLEWTVRGGILFGKQTYESSEDRFGEYFRDNDGLLGTSTTTTLYDDVDVLRSRKEDVTVPNLSLSLGVSYSIDRVKVSTGYAYDRFFDAIDGGFEESKQYDRTIHGPFVKFSLGFGG